MTSLATPNRKIGAEFLDVDGDIMRVQQVIGSESFGIKFASTYREFPNTDAPAVALAILTAAGVQAADTSNSDLFRGDEAGAEWAVMWLEKLAEVQRIKSAADILNERRDALASEIDKDATCYEGTCVVARAAIDMIIQLQDEATK